MPGPPGTGKTTLAEAAPLNVDTTPFNSTLLHTESIEGPEKLICLLFEMV